MPTLVRGETSIHYEVSGDGYPLVLFAPGGMRSSIKLWDRAPFHPIRELSSKFRVIAMDQRNAGKSHAPVAPSDGWETYTDDHVALLDELGVTRCHILGMCIGSAFCLSLLARVPERISAAVLEQPIGLTGENRAVFYEMFDGWADDLAAARPEVPRAALSSFRHNLYDRDFAFSVSRDQVKKCETPLLVLRGNDIYHPADVSEEIVRIAPNATLVQSWKEGDALVRALTRVKEFFDAHTPS